MKKTTNKSVILAMAAVLSMSALSACGSKAVAAESKTEKAVETTAESEASKETETSGSSDDKLKPFPEDSSEAASDEVYIDMQPVSKWGYIESVDEANKKINFNSNEFTVDDKGNYSETTSEIVLNVADSTPILDGTTLAPVAMSDIDTSAPVYVWVAQAMTMSMPPQTAAQVIIVNVPEDASAPMYVIAQKVENTDGGIIITDQDGVKWRADGDTEVMPYLTRNIVTLDDIKEGTRLVLTQDSAVTTSGTEKAGDADAYAAKILVFAD